MKCYEVCNKWEISFPTYKAIKNKLLKELGFVNNKAIDIYFQDRLNIKRLVQDLLTEKTAKDITDIFDEYIKAYKFMIRIFNSKITISDNDYEKCLLIINKFERIKDEYQPTKNSNS